MSRILKLLQQLGVFSSPDDFTIVAVLDKYSMSERGDDGSSSGSSGGNGGGGGGGGGGGSGGGGSVAAALVQQVVVPAGALPGQQIEIAGASAGQPPMVVVVPAGLVAGDSFLVTHKSAFSEVSKEEDVDKDELLLALQMSMGSSDGDNAGSSDGGGSGGGSAMAVDGGAEGGEGAEGGAHADASVGDNAGVAGSGNASGGAAAVAPAPAVGIQQGRSRRKYIKPLSLIWACKEFVELYTEKNTLIVDDTLDVCGINPHNFIQCTRYSRTATACSVPTITIAAVYDSSPTQLCFHCPLSLSHVLLGFWLSSMSLCILQSVYLCRCSAAGYGISTLRIPDVRSTVNTILMLFMVVRYNWQDHATDSELPRLSKYLSKIAEDPKGFPTSHAQWRDDYM